MRGVPCLRDSYLVCPAVYGRSVGTHNCPVIEDAMLLCLKNNRRLLSAPQIKFNISLQQKLGILFITVSGTALGPTQSPIQWIPGALSLGVKRLGREADHSPPSNAKVKE
jgi:hypothetical protein